MSFQVLPTTPHNVGILLSILGALTIRLASMGFVAHVVKKRKKSATCLTRVVVGSLVCLDCPG